MDRKREDGFKPGTEPDRKDEIEKEAKKSREALDAIPPPGTDPLHEGP